MRTRLPAALLLLLSALFVAGGTTPPASVTAAVHAQIARAADHQQILPHPARPHAHAGKGVHAVGGGGLAVLTARPPYGRHAHLATAVDVRPRALGGEHLRRAPARAPPSSTSLT
ncbi:hypothetical protein AB0B45_15930 [Nonomuraea sp. NPDC049152]|uniref:hypothetical protein n=1 Tax=Nonomuraea sp. NPDC049152 TaxID=3154350 RepID=UPI0034066A3D